MCGVFFERSDLEGTKTQSSENKIRKQVGAVVLVIFPERLLFFQNHFLFGILHACEAMIIQLSYVFFFVRPSLGSSSKSLEVAGSAHRQQHCLSAENF